MFQFSNFNEGSTGMYADSITIVIERQYLIQGGIGIYLAFIKSLQTAQ